MKKPINNVFLTYVSDILADTVNGLTSSEIGKYFSAKSLDHNVEVPHYKPPFAVAYLNKSPKIAMLPTFSILN